MPIEEVFGPLGDVLSTGGGYILAVLAFIWPFAAFVALIVILRSTWLFWRQSIFEHSIPFILLELKIPREITKSPRAMEQTLMAIHSLRNIASDLQEKYWDGEVTRWYSMEIASFSGEVHLYFRTYRKQRPLVEAAFFSYYPDVELVEVSDYAEQLPLTVRDMYDQGYDMWGSEMKLARSEAYPIKTYLEFESPDEEKQFDPISTFLEVLGKLKKGEFVAVQFLIAPAGEKWAEEFEPLVEKLRQTTKREKVTTPEGALESFTSFVARSPGQTDVLKAVERNLSKPAFETIIRFIYLSPRAIYYDSFARRALTGIFNQYAALDLNFFKRNEKTATRTRFWYFPYLFHNFRNEYRKQRMLSNYLHRTIPPETFMGRVITSKLLNWNSHTRWIKINTECLATLFHPPTHGVLTAPHIQRMESRKAGPPAGLPIYGDEKDIEQYQ